MRSESWGVLPLNGEYITRVPSTPSVALKHKDPECGSYRALAFARNYKLSWYGIFIWNSSDTDKSYNYWIYKGRESIFWHTWTLVYNYFLSTFLLCCTNNTFRETKKSWKLKREAIFLIHIHNIIPLVTLWRYHLDTSQRTSLPAKMRSHIHNTSRKSASPREQHMSVSVM